MAGPRTVDTSAAENPGEHGQDGWLTSDGGEGRVSALPPSARSPSPHLSRGAGETPTLGRRIVAAGASGNSSRSVSLIASFARNRAAGSASPGKLP